MFPYILHFVFFLCSFQLFRNRFTFKTTVPRRIHYVKKKHLGCSFPHVCQVKGVGTGLKNHGCFLPKPGIQVVPTHTQCLTALIVYIFIQGKLSIILCGWVKVLKRTHRLFLSWQHSRSFLHGNTGSYSKRNIISQSSMSPPLTYTALR